MIKIISGTYGLRKGNRVIPKSSKSEPFEADPAEEKRLIDLGIAEEVQPPVIEPAKAPEPDPEENNSIDYESMSVIQLKEFAKKQGIKLPKNAKRADIVAAIMSAESDDNEDTPDEEEPCNEDMPNIQAQLPE